MHWAGASALKIMLSPKKFFDGLKPDESMESIHSVRILVFVGQLWPLPWPSPLKQRLRSKLRQATYRRSELGEGLLGSNSLLNILTMNVQLKVC